MNSSSGEEKQPDKNIEFCVASSAAGELYKLDKSDMASTALLPVATAHSHTDHLLHQNCACDLHGCAPAAATFQL